MLNLLLYKAGILHVSLNYKLDQYGEEKEIARKVLSFLLLYKL